MKAKYRSIIVCSALLATPQIASASLLLAGWYGFNSSDQPLIDTSHPAGVTATLSTTASGNHVVVGHTGGTTDTTYGGQDTGFLNPGSPPDIPAGSPASFSTPTGPSGEARLRLNDTLVFTVTNMSGHAYTLESLMFDAAFSGTKPIVGSVRYKFDWMTDYADLNNYEIDANGDYSKTGSNFTPAKITTATVPVDYTDYDYLMQLSNKVPLFLGNTGSVSFEVKYISGAGSLLLGNMVLSGYTPIPESGSLLALGCLVGSGTFLRSRRRR